MILRNILMMLFCLVFATACVHQHGTSDAADPSLKVGEDGHTYRCQPACKEWGESCVNIGEGGQRCRRSCLRFGEECFRVEYEQPQS